jgi:hypothetical protein
MRITSALCAATALALLLNMAEAANTFPQRAQSFHYLDAASNDLQQMMPTPDMSRGDERELTIVLARQAKLTPAEISRARADAIPRPLAYVEVLGPYFLGHTLPATQLLLANAESDLEALAAPAIKAWSRAAPSMQDSRVKQLARLPSGSAYPSERAAVGRLWSGILAQLFPNCTDQLTKRGIDLGENQILVGAAYPSDVAAGRQLADQMLARFQQSTTFRGEMAAAAAEIKQVGAQGHSIGIRCGP